MCSITISFDLNTQKLWDDLHLPYETYTSFFRHLILLEKYFRNGDLVLSENASQKSQSYIKSLQNRIEEFEVKHKRSHADLSAVTRPDLSVPGGYSVLGPAPPLIDPPTTTSRSHNKSSSHETAGSTSKKHDSSDGSTILRIPKVSMPSTSSVPTPVTSPVPNMPTKLRVRKDLMYLGLMANPPSASAPASASTATSATVGSNAATMPSPKGLPSTTALQQLDQQQSNVMSESQRHQQASKQLAEMVNQAASRASSAAVASSATAMSTSKPSGGLLRQQISSPPQNLMQLLNDPTLKQKAKGPVLGKTSLVASSTIGGTPLTATSGTSKSSNSQLFKNTESSGSSAIPLTFNNSIAEVLAAAAKSKSREAGSNSGQKDFVSKPEVTITAKSFNKPSSASSWTSTTASTLTTSSSSASKKQQSATNFGPAVNKNIPKVNPLLDMNNLLRNQLPGVPPHIVAQNTLSTPNISAATLPTKPISTHQMAGTMPKIAPKLTASLLKPIPVSKPSGMSASISKSSVGGIGTGSKPSGVMGTSSTKPGGGITSVNKKSLNTVLDRLSGLKGTSSSGNMSGGSVTQQTSATSSGGSFRPAATSSPSSLVQQLQAPPMMANPGIGSPTKNNRVPSSPAPIPTVVGGSSERGQSSATGSNPGGASSSQTAANLQSLQSLMAQQGLLGMGFPSAATSGLVGQPMVQYPWSTSGVAPSTNSSAQQDALAQAQRALSMAGAGLPGMNQAAAAAAFQEILKLSLQAQQASGSTGTGSKGPNNPGQTPRIRAPPPLTHMGRPGGINPSSQGIPKPHKPE